MERQSCSSNREAKNDAFHQSDEGVGLLSTGAGERKKKKSTIGVRKNGALSGEK